MHDCLGLCCWGVIRYHSQLWVLQKSLDLNSELRMAFDQVSSSLFKILDERVFVRCTRVKLPCQLCVDRVYNGPIFVKFRSKLRYSGFRVRLANRLIWLIGTHLASGFLFFGTISHVEDTIRAIIEGPSWHTNPVRFLVLDLSLVAGVDMSSAEAFVRIHRFLSAKAVTLVFCGFSMDSPVARALTSVHVLGSDDVELFSTYNDAMECKLCSFIKHTVVAMHLSNLSLSYY